MVERYTHDDELERIGKEEFVASSRHSSNIYLKRARKPMKNVSQNSLCPGRSLPKYMHRWLHLDQPAQLNLLI
jgi:hypothetical protein